MISLAQQLERLQVQGQQMQQQTAGVVHAGPVVSPVHTAAVEVFTDLLELGERMNTAETPAYLKAMMLGVRKARPMLLEGIAKMPAAQLKAFMGELAGKLNKIVEAPEE